MPTLEKCVWLNGILDLIMVAFHIVTGFSWWSPYNIGNEYLYFAALYGATRALYPLGAGGLISITYALEALYFSKIMAPVTSIVCILLSFLTFAAP